MPKVTTLDGMASMLHLDTDTLVAGLQGLNILNPSGSPKAAQVRNGNFNSDGSIKDYSGLKQTIEDKLDEKK